MNLFSKLRSSQNAAARPETSLLGKNETFKYGGGAINIVLRLSPERQDDFEVRLNELKRVRDELVHNATLDYDRALHEINVTKADALDSAREEFTRALRGLFIEFNEPAPATAPLAGVDRSRPEPGSVFPLTPRGRRRKVRADETSEAQPVEPTPEHDAAADDVA